MFLAHKRALGCGFRVEELSLRLFDRFLLEQHITALSAIASDVVDAFLASRPRHAPRSYNHLRGTLVRLFAWLAAQDLFGTSPVRARPRRSTRARLPCLFDDATAHRLLDIASRLPDKGGTVSRGHTYRVMFTLLYGLGLRVGEVARLCVDAVDLTRDLLVIRQTKFYKSRLVPFSPGIRTVVLEHLARRARPANTISPSTPVSSLRRRRPAIQARSVRRFTSSCRSSGSRFQTGPWARACMTCAMRLPWAHCCAGTGVGSTPARACYSSRHYSATPVPSARRCT